MTQLLDYTPPRLPDDEALRLDALRRYAILDTPPDESFDRIARLAARILKTPSATISLVDEDRQWFKARVGFEPQETPREISFCGHTILGNRVMVVPDATRDPRFAGNPLVTAPAGLRFYAGAPLRSPDGHNLGALCVFDSQSRALAPEDEGVLEDLAHLVIGQLELLRAGRHALAEVAERQRAEAALLERQQQLKEVQRLAHLGDWRWPIGGQAMHWSAELFRIFRLDRASFEPRLDAFLDLVLRDDREQVQAWLHEAVRERRTQSCEFRMACAGSLLQFRAEARCDLDEQGEVAALFGICQDVTERRDADQRIRHLAHHDSLTGLPNRARFQERLEAALALARRSRRRVALMLLDLDHFKNINDTLGHDAGDALLREVGSRLQRCVRESDTVARLGGDEFAVIQVELDQDSDIGAAAARILAAIALPLHHGGHEMHAATSIGISLFPSDADAPQPLLKNADIALYRAKAEGRGSFAFFQSSMTVEIEQRRAVEHELREALAHDRLELVYQPIIALGDGALHGFEALLRWRRGGELRSIAEVLAIAEETGLIVPIGELVVRRAATDLRIWLDAGFAPGRVALNLAAPQFERGDLALTINAIFADSQLGFDHLAVEVTERVLLGRRSERVSQSLAALHRQGATIALDDFGTGYGSLAHLKQFPVDHLKIDPSFVQGIGEDPDDAAIVRAVINLGHSLGKTVIAEGVETEAQADFLRLHGCDFAQGYLFARPMSGNLVPPFLRGYTAHQPAELAAAG